MIHYESCFKLRFNTVIELKQSLFITLLFLSFPYCKYLQLKTVTQIHSKSHMTPTMKIV